MRALGIAQVAALAALGAVTTSGRGGTPVELTKEAMRERKAQAAAPSLTLLHRARHLMQAQLQGVPSAEIARREERIQWNDQVEAKRRAKKAAKSRRVHDSARRA